jgi:hypothetical protein
MKTLLDKLQEIDKSFEFHLNEDIYESKSFEIDWLESDIYKVSQITQDLDTGIINYHFIDLMSEGQLLKYLQMWY